MQAPIRRGAPSVILDAKCVLGDGRKTNIEVQKANDDDHQRRVRYNGAILTTNLTDPGEKFKDVPDVCVVFISRFDIFNGNLPLYHVDRMIRENGKKVDNGFEEVYVNAKVKDGSDVSELMEVLSTTASTTTNFLLSPTAQLYFYNRSVFICLYHCGAVAHQVVLYS